MLLMKMWKQRVRKIFLSLLLVTGIVEHSEQCLSKSAITEGVDETPLHIEQPGFRRERELLQPIALRSVHRRLFQPPQHLLYGFTPVMAEKRANVQSYTKKESYQSNAETNKKKIELVNIPGPPYNHQAENKLRPRKTSDQTPSLLQPGQENYQMESQRIFSGEQNYSTKQRSIVNVQPANNNKRNMNYSTTFQHLNVPHGSGNNTLKENRESQKKKSIWTGPF